MQRSKLFIGVVVALVLVASCAPATPQVVEKEVVVEKPVVETVIVEKEVVVEKPVVETVVVEKEVVVEKLVTPVAPARPVRDNIIVANAVDVSTLDPYNMFSRYETSVSDHVIQYLVFRGSDMSMQPQLATEWKRLEDDLTWEFKLREGVTFSNGEPFNATAVKFSIDNLNKRAEEGKPLGHSNIAMPMAEITKVDIVDDYTVRIVTASPKALLPFAVSQMPILAPEFYSQASDGQRAEEMIGTGPYVLAERVRDSHTTLRVNPDYWGPKPKVEELIFRAIPEMDTQVAELETGGVDIVPGLPFDMVPLLQGTPGLRMETIEGGRRVWIGINSGHLREATSYEIHPALADTRVRQALNYAIDFDAINEGLFMGRAKRMTYIVNPPYANTNIKPYTYDPEKAKQLLAEAGYPDGLELQVLITPIGRWIKDYELVQAVKAQLEEIGVTFKEGLLAYEWGVFREILLSRDLPDMFMQASGGEFEGQAEVVDFGSSDNFYNWYNPEYDALWLELQAELDMDRRHEIVMEMQEIVYEDPPVIFLYMQLDSYGVSDRVDWKPRMDEMIDLWDVSIVK